ncbi:DeoR/GlpR family DNA-binding transcription regulator [Peptoniphilus indolicus]|nr:DeoR/GlpR family DNA-binding transcription regulator [Peptoniphilus indolicus]SUB74600.1 Glycerol-3-phosphate regulon repressor [Peptoniphilus indolicus]
MNKEIRTKEIYRQLKNSEFITIEKLAEKFNVSEMTIRRDLLELEQKGLAVRGIGGAYPSRALDVEVSIDEKKVKNINKKRKIAEEAINLIKEDMTVFLDSGSTCYELSKKIKLRDFSHLNVITQDLSIINYLKETSGINLIVLGGLLSNETNSMNGILTQLCLERLSADIAFLGASSISNDLKIFTPSENKILSKIEMVKNSKKSILIADSGKINNSNLYYVHDVKDFDLFITDQGLSSEFEKRLIESEIKYMKV